MFVHTGNRVTLKQLAAHLDLGITTVSDILLREKTNYRKKTVDRVRQAAVELGFQPNALAQGMRRGRTQTIGLLVTFNILDPFFAELVNRLEDRLEKAGFMVLLSISEDDLEKDRRAIAFFESRRVDGLIIGPIYNREAIKPVVQHYTNRLPTVLFLAGDEAPGDAVILKDGHRGLGQMAAQTFLDAGHRRIGYLMCPAGARHDAGDQTYRGFFETLEPLGLFRPEWVWVEKRPLAELAYQRMQAILAAHPRAELPTAIYCHNDYCAMGALAAIKEAGYRTPEDFSLMGIDNIAASAFTDPPLTTVDLHPSKLADEAFALLIERLQHPTRPAEHRAVRPTLVERASVRMLAGPGLPPSPGTALKRHSL